MAGSATGWRGEAGRPADDRRRASRCTPRCTPRRPRGSCPGGLHRIDDHQRRNTRRNTLRQIDRTYDYVQLLLFAILGAIGAVAWSALTRRRSHPRLAAAAHVVLRYALAHAMLSYGFAKIFRLQFGDLNPLELRTPVG
jgi:hypothetical protein